METTWTQRLHWNVCVYLRPHAMRHQTKVKMQFDYFALIGVRRSSKKCLSQPSKAFIIYVELNIKAKLGRENGKNSKSFGQSKVTTNETKHWQRAKREPVCRYDVDSNFQVSTWNAIKIFMSNCSSDKLIDCQSTDNYTCTNDCTTSYIWRILRAKIAVVFYREVLVNFKNLLFLNFTSIRSF